MIEPRHTGIGDYPVWPTAHRLSGYLERLSPAIVAFEIAVRDVRVICKLHQTFPAEDRRSIAARLARSHREQARAVADKSALHAVISLECLARTRKLHLRTKSSRFGIGPGVSAYRQIGHARGKDTMNGIQLP